MHAKILHNEIKLGKKIFLIIWRMKCYSDSLHIKVCNSGLTDCTSVQSNRYVLVGICPKSDGIIKFQWAQLLPFLLSSSLLLLFVLTSFCIVWTWPCLNEYELRKPLNSERFKKHCSIFVKNHDIIKFVRS